MIAARTRVWSRIRVNAQVRATARASAGATVRVRVGVRVRVRVRATARVRVEVRVRLAPQRGGDLPRSSRSGTRVPIHKGVRGQGQGEDDGTSHEGFTRARVSTHKGLG